MLTNHTKTLIKQLNNLRRVACDTETERVQNTLAQADILNTLANMSTQTVETQNLIFDAINALEALAYTLDIQHSTHVDYVNIQRTLGLLYIDYATAKEDTRLLNVARKILKPLGSDDVRILAGLLTIAVLKGENSLSQFYAKKLIKHDGTSPHTIDINILTAYQHTDWYAELATVIKVH